jgi:hypothetical protein
MENNWALSHCNPEGKKERPSSPLLFNMVVEVLPRAIDKKIE